MHSFLLNSNLSEIDSLDDVETIWYIISNFLINAIDAFIPKYKIKTNSFKFGLIVKLNIESIAYEH